MARLRELKRLREDRFAGVEVGKPVYVPPELDIRGFKVRFYDTSDVKIGELGSDVKIGRVEEVEFELMGFGCSAFKLTIDDYPGFDILYRTRLDIHPYFDVTPWFTGFIQSIPQPGQKRPFTYLGFGFFEQLDWVLITDSYESQEVSVIVKDIIQNTVAPSTQIVYNASKVDVTAYTVESMNFDHIPAKDAIQALADIAQGWEFGVDNSREFYFREIDTDVYYHYWASKHFQEVELVEDPHAIRNKLYVKLGQIQESGSNIIGEVHDDPSIASYGLREMVITAPEMIDSDDALQWAAQILAEKKNPEVKAKIDNVLLDADKLIIDSKGKVRLTAYEGSEYTLAIKKVGYSIAKSGILATLELE